MNQQISNEALQEIIALAAKTSNLNQIAGVDRNYIVGQDENEFFQFAKLQNADDAAYAEKVIRAGKEMALELIELRHALADMEKRSKEIYEIAIELRVMNIELAKTPGDLPAKSVKNIVAEIRRLTNPILGLHPPRKKEART